MTPKPGVEIAVADAAVREEVLDCRSSFIVQAPAGSGKTELLMQRYLALLATVEEPEAVLAITFTIKAASEMRNRILGALTAAQRGDVVSKPHEQRTRELALAVIARDRECGWNLLENSARMQIRTVDSFCESVARRAPLLAGLGASLNITESVGPIYDEAARRTIDLLGSDDETIAQAMMTLLMHVDNDIVAVQRLFFNMLEQRDRWLRLITPTLATTDLHDLRAMLEQSLTAAVRDELQAVRKRWKSDVPRKEEDRLLTLARFAASTLDVEERFKQFATWKDVPGSEIGDMPAWCAWSDWLLTGKKWRSQGSRQMGFPPGSQHPTYKRAKQEYAEALDLFREERREALLHSLYRVTKLPQPQYTDDQWQFVCALFRILPRAVENLKAVFVERGLMDFAELSQSAIEALATTDRMQSLRHILVDEFQDTSTTQIELLSRLTATWSPGDSRTLFLVGDPMQSIYGFREAEVVLFERTRQSGVRGLRLLSRKLEVNFRSQQPLVEWFNDTFPHLMRETNDLRGAVSYEACTAIKPAAEIDSVEIHPFYSDDPQPEAEQVVTLVRDALQTTNGSVAILVRARTHLPAIVEALRHARISYRGVELDPLNTRQAVLDIDALAQAIEHIADRSAWLAILRAPWCGLTLADLWELCREDKDTPIIDLLQQRFARLTSDAQQRISRILPAMQYAVAQYGRTPLRPLLEATWISLGGPAAVRAGVDGEADLRDISAYLNLVQECETAGALPERGAFERRMSELYAAPDTSDGIRVEIMTIFAAKGLEFDTVIVPGLGRTVRGDTQSLLYWRERILGGEAHLLLAPMEAVSPEDKEDQATLESYLQRIERDRDREEGKRLLYVAATRARYKLHLLGHTNANAKADADSLLNLLMAAPDVEAIFQQNKPAEEQAERETFEIAASVRATRVAPTLRRLPGNWQLPAPPIPVSRKQKSADVPARVESPHTFDWVSDTLRRVGTVTHAFLQQIGREGLDKWTTQRVEQSASAFRIALTAEGVPTSEIASALAKVTRALHIAITQDRGRWILSSHAEAESELELSGSLDGQIIGIKLDRTFVDENGTRWIIDYKTADMSGSSLERFLDAQEEKYRPDLMRYARLMCAFDSRPVRAGLYLPLLGSWREVNLDVASESNSVS